MYYINFIAFVVCLCSAIYQGYQGNIGLCLFQIALALINLPQTIIWLKEFFNNNKQNRRNNGKTYL